MKIAIRAGHNFQAIGAKGIICETTEARKVKDSVYKYLKNEGHDVLDVTPENIESNLDLKFGVNKANEWEAEIFISIHFNKAYDNYNGAIGTECWVLNKESKAVEIGNNIVSKIGETGLKNRGVKFNSFYELKNTKMPAVIIEVCFVEATKDVEIYESQGVEKFGMLITEGILNKKIASEEKPTISELFRVRVEHKQIGAYSKLESIIDIVRDNFGMNLIEIEKVL